MRVSLLLGERRPGLNALGGIRDRPIERRPARPQSEGRHHHTRVTEDHLRLQQALAFYAADEPVGVNVHVVESQRCRVAQTNAVLILGLIVSKALHALLHDEPAWPYGRVGQYGVNIGDATVADPLLAAVDLVANDLAVFLDAIGGRLQCTQVAASFRLRRAVSEQNSFLSNATQPFLLLLCSGTESYGIAAKECGK